MSPEIRISLAFLFLSVIFIFQVASVPYGRPDGHPHLTLYEHRNQKGQRYHQDLGDRCYNLPKAFDDRASSLDTYNRCIRVCIERDCKRCYKMARGTPGHFDLNEIGMNDAISSFSRC